MRFAASVGLLFGAGALPASAQLSPQHLPGVAGLKAGSQPPPQVYVTAPFVHVYRTGTVRSEGGAVAASATPLTTVIYGAGFSVVMDRRLFGANYGFQVLFPTAARNRIQGTDISARTGHGITDTALTPISLGWHSRRADAIAAYSMFIPTGQYVAGTSSNQGLGMWGHQLSLGGTLYGGASKTFHAAAVAGVGFHSRKKRSETRVGTVVTLEGGVGADVRRGLAVGVRYSGSLKVTPDRFDDASGPLVPGRSRSLSLGPEVRAPLAWSGAVHGFITFSYQRQVYARAATQGSEVMLLTTLLINPVAERRGQ